MEQIMIEVTKLDLSPRNARRTVAQGSTEELKASILAHGLMQNLVVTAGDGRYRVIAGGRRLEALGRKLLGEQWALARKTAKKGELADALERAFVEPGR